LIPPAYRNLGCSSLPLIINIFKNLPASSSSANKTQQTCPTMESIQKTPETLDPTGLY